MSDPLPDAATLLLAAADYLEAELLPTLDGYHRFQTRIAVNALRTVTRELQLAPAARSAEHARLAALLGHDGAPAELEAALACALLDGQHAIDDPALVQHLRLTLHDTLTVNNPKWAAQAAPDISQPRTSI